MIKQFRIRVRRESSTVEDGILQLTAESAPEAFQRASYCMDANPSPVEWGPKRTVKKGEITMVSCELVPPGDEESGT